MTTVLCPFNCGIRGGWLQIRRRESSFTLTEIGGWWKKVLATLKRMGGGGAEKGLR